MKVRKITTIVEEVLLEGGKDVEPAARTAVVAAIIENPWKDQGFVDDLSAGIDKVAPELGQLLAPRVMEALGTPLEAYGKAAIVGLDGEIERGWGLIRSIKFGTYFCDAAAASQMI